jgi:2-dehydro-3-deoxyphosphogluconate aldolase/(4S)-4-hydroxy-2-oxoglutarate aldolase
MEVTLNTPGALEAISAIRAAMPEMVCGAGTILMADDAVAAMGAGAQFVITPTLQVETVAVCRGRGVLVCVGCASPTEAMTAHRAGADFIKVFPAGTFGLAHIGAMLREMPQVNLVPTGGVTPENLHAFFDAGCRVAAVGSQLVSREVLRARDWDRVTNLARRYVEAIAKWRSESRK